MSRLATQLVTWSMVLTYRQLETRVKHKSCTDRTVKHVFGCRTINLLREKKTCINLSNRATEVRADS